MILASVLLISNVVMGTPRICLNMIVKNESHVIHRSLNSVKDLIDYWVIVDTGSTDGTQQIIQKLMQGIPGQLEEREWKNFAHNRNEALELAKPHGDYILFLDADDWIEFEKDFVIPTLTEDSYIITMQHRDKGFSYGRKQLIKASKPWYWKDVLHEYLKCDEPASEGSLKQIEYVFGGGGARSQDSSKYLHAVRILQEGLEKEPDNERYVFYLAESLRDANFKETAIQQYAKRVKMGRWNQEVFWSLLQIAQLKNALNYPNEELVECYFRAHCFRPHRAEPVYYLAHLFNKTGQHALAYSCIKGFQYIPSPQIKDVLFNMDWINEYGLNFELSLAAYYLGNIEEFRAICENLLRIENLPTNFRQSVEQNLSLI